MYKMVLKMTKGTWGKCGITAIKHYNKKEDIIELWQKMNYVKRETEHLNISDTALRRIKKYCGQKIKDITEKKKYKVFFEDKDGIFVIEKLTRDIIEHCELPKAIELRKKLGYNHNDIMICEETSIAEKIIKLFPKENIVLNKKFNNRKPDIWYKDNNNIIEVDEGNHEKYDSDDEKEREDMFKNHNSKIFSCNPNNPEFDLLKFLGEIILYISKLSKENAVNRVINKIAEDFEKIVAVTKSKELKRYAKNILPNYKK